MGDGWRWVAALVLAAAVGLAALPARAPQPAVEWGRPRRTAEGLAVPVAVTAPAGGRMELGRLAAVCRRDGRTAAGELRWFGSPALAPGARRQGLAVFPMPPDTSGLAFSLVVCYHNHYKILW